MAYYCTDCCEELRPTLISTGGGAYHVPIGWTGICSKAKTEWGERWDHWIQHDKCKDGINHGRVEWLASPFPNGEEATCQDCDGSGNRQNTYGQDYACPECGGSGRGEEAETDWEVCVMCDGTGICEDCGGSGKTKKQFIDRGPEPLTDAMGCDV